MFIILLMKYQMVFTQILWKWNLSKLSIVDWKENYSLYDLGIIYKQQYRLEVQAMQEESFKRCLEEENKWKD